MPLYKYFPPTRGSVLESCSLRVTPFNELNDPFEAAPIFATPQQEFLEDRLRRLITEEISAKNPTIDPETKTALIEEKFNEHIGPFLAEAERRHHWENISYTMQHKISSQWGTICLSESADNLLMWSHYADGHTGFVLGFDENHHQFQGARPVIYTKTRPEIHQDKGENVEFYRSKYEAW